VLKDNFVWLLLVIVATIFVLTDYKNGDHVTLQCPTNSVISIEYAEYKKTGWHGCYDTNAKQNVADECDGKQQCQFTVGSAFFGSACRWYNAKLKLRYTCIAGKPIYSQTCPCGLLC